ncbi:MAG: hypothetical protein RL632_1725 [Bacteroidota bacterium]|jgi:hypothetical protein
MKILFSTLIALALVSGMVSCTKVIDIKLNDKDPQYVIEGHVTLGDSVHRIEISQTLNISDSSQFPAVNNAVVILTDDLGNSQAMNLVAPGRYETVNYPISADRTYTLQVTIDGQLFLSTASVPQEVTLLNVLTFPFSFGPQSFNAIVPLRLDPGGVANYYEFKLLKHGKPLRGIFIQSDQYNDGNLAQEPIFADGINSGDTIDVEMLSINREVYDFFFTLQQNQQGSTPANPTSNIIGGCIGYFSVQTKSQKQVIIP